MANLLLTLFCRNTKVWFYSGNPVVDGKQRKSREKERKYNNERVKEIESAICGFISVFFNLCLPFCDIRVKICCPLDINKNKEIK